MIMETPAIPQPAEKSEADLLHRSVAVAPIRSRPGDGGQAGAGDSLDRRRQPDCGDGAPRSPLMDEPAVRKCAVNSGNNKG